MATPDREPDTQRPLGNLDEWEDFLKERYPAGKPRQTTANVSPFTDSSKKKVEFRNYAATVRPSVREFYRLNHRHQTFDFVRQKKRSTYRSRSGA